MTEQNAAAGPYEIVCCSPFDSGWRWLSHRLDPSRYTWRFFAGERSNFLEKRLPRPNLAILKACFQCALYVKRNAPDLLCTFDPRCTFWTGFFLQRMGARVRHFACAFNYPELPTGHRLALEKRVYEDVEKFIVFSNAERELYHETFGIPRERMEFRFWAVEAPEVNARTTSPWDRDYICAVGGNARDYGTLFGAMALAPEVPLIAVMRPNNLKGLEVPDNVRVEVNIPIQEVIRIMQHARFMVLALKDAEVPCGHVTIVNNMHMGKALVTTASTGIMDYVHDGTTAVVCEAYSAQALADAIRRLWNNPERCEELGRNAQHFARTHCLETNAVDSAERMLKKALPG